jgi:hypothetical protein
MPSRLKGLKVVRVDLVDRGASYDPLTGEGAHVVLYKRAPQRSAKSTDDVPSGQATQSEWMAFIEEQARLNNTTVERFLRSDRGIQFYHRYRAAPLKPVPVMTPDPPTIDKSLAELRRDAVEESRVHPDDVYERIAEDAAAAFPVLAKHEACVKFLHRHPERYDEYRNAFKTGTRAREQYAAALAAAELEPVTAALEADGLEPHEAFAEALRLVPGIAKVHGALVAKAREGARVFEHAWQATDEAADLEAGHGSRVEMVQKLMGAAHQTQKRHASGVEPQPIGAREALRKVLGDRPGLAAAAASGNPEDARHAGGFSLSQLRTDHAAYAAYRERVLSGGTGDDAA